MNHEFARVHILDMPYKADKAYDYYIPPRLRQSLRVGSLVDVPFGNGNRRQTGVVVAEYDRPELLKEADTNASKIPDGKGAAVTDKPLKPIKAVYPEQCTLDGEILDICRFMKEMTLCTIGDAVRTVMPTALISYAEPFYSVGENPLKKDISGDIGADLLSVYSYISHNNGAFLGTLRYKFGERVGTVLEKLEETECIVSNSRFRNPVVKTVKYVRLTLNPDRLSAFEDGTLKLGSERQRLLLEILAENDGYMKLSELLDADKRLSRTQIASLEKRGFISLEDVETRRDPLLNVEVPEPPQYKLVGEQITAFEKLEAMYLDEKPRAALLFGVTGSGKTAVMIKTIDRIIADGKSVIVLLPEIALTPQMMGIFRSYYGKRVAVMHSGLSDGERMDTYTAVKEGRSDIVVGTRSAVFAPVKKLGAIIIDEEQEHTYKSDVNPKYHARDIARFRCAANNALMLLMSATPSIESYAKALDGKYELITLTKRYGNAKLPDVTIADMRKESGAGNITPLGTALVNSLCEVKERGEQSVLFINRRGYHNFMSCKSCGEAVLCPYCSVSLTYHKTSTGQGYMCCHWCGHREPVPKVCPSCGSEHLGFTGYGTQHIEEDLGKLMPGVRILRMDTDTTNTKQSYYEILGKFRAHEADILLGTQMVTKGHDFPDVTLVGVLLADMSLYLDDYRASERTFSMLTQVIGRAGRASKAGRAVIQTNNPDNDIIRLACAQDYFTFAKNELRLRRSLVFPPYCDIVLLTATGASEKEVSKCITAVNAEIIRLTAVPDKNKNNENTEKTTEPDSTGNESAEKAYKADKADKADKGADAGAFSDVKLITFGPFEAPVYRVDKKYRMRMVVKCRLNKRSRALFSELLGHFGTSGRKAVTLSVDFNPSSL